MAAVLLSATFSAQAQIAQTAPKLLNSNGASDGFNESSPVVSTDGSGTWIAAAPSAEDIGGAGNDWDIVVFRSTNDGVSWSAPALLHSNGTGDTESDFSPSIAGDGAGNWVIVWQSGEDLSSAGTDNDIFVVASSDDGLTWSAPALVNSNAASDTRDDYSAKIATDAAGNWIVVWYSTEDLGSVAGSDSDIFVSISANNGATWSAVALLNSNATTDTGADVSPSIDTDGAGKWVVAWESSDTLGGSIGTDYDIVFASSADNGATWSPLSLLNSNGAADAGDDRSCEITTDEAGNWVIVWGSDDDLLTTIDTDWDILVASSADNAVSWSAPILLNTNGTSDTEDDRIPHIATDGLGNWVSTWYSAEDLGGSAGADDDVFTALSTDDGATWSATALLNTNGNTDTGDDTNSSIATNGAGDWVAAWVSNENLSGAGTDRDLFITRFGVGGIAPPSLPAAALSTLLAMASGLLLLGTLITRRNRRQRKN